MLKSDRVAADVLSLGILKKLHATHGDELFYGDVDWYNEAKALI